jgi:outer membrane murein-binding lipoprotein Lpp
MKFTLIAAIVAGLLSCGCSSRQVYDAAAGWRQTECNKLLDDAARARCLATAGQDYDAYRKQQ